MILFIVYGIDSISNSWFLSFSEKRLGGNGYTLHSFL